MMDNKLHALQNAHHCDLCSKPNKYGPPTKTTTNPPTTEGWYWPEPRREDEGPTFCGHCPDYPDKIMLWDDRFSEWESIADGQEWWSIDGTTPYRIPEPEGVER
jgi:hypothetical protein